MKRFLKQFNHLNFGITKVDFYHDINKGGVKMAKLLKRMFSLIGLGSTVRW
jgi:hypothetical protein